jgi:Fur family transcriptional regulator, zinc uptake regulator
MDGRPEHRAVAAAVAAAEVICGRSHARLTRTRRLVFEQIVGAGRPMTAYELVDRLRSVDCSATPAGVYRSLDFLGRHGLVHRLESSKAFVACAIPDHAHPSQMLVCRNCGAAVEAEDRRVATAAEALGKRLGFALDRRTIELTGVCPACQH